MDWLLERLSIRLLLGRDLEQKIAAAFEWLSEVVVENDHILVDLLQYRRCFSFEFPLHIGDPPKTVKPGPDARETFIIRRPAAQPHGDDWATIFSLSELEILERKSRTAGMPPLRWKLTEAEKQSAFTLARTALEYFLQSGTKLELKDLPDMPPRFRLTADTDVALWVGGRLRGSYPIQNVPLWRGIVDAVVAASRDTRFKPLQQAELSETRIEITLMLHPRIPLVAGDRRENRILPEKGYLLRQGTARGWYLPEVFNVRRFPNLHDLASELAREKAGIAPAEAAGAELFVFEVDDFIESSDQGRVLPLRGPMVAPESISVEDPEFLRSRLRAAADWLCRIQEPDGNLPPIIDPFALQKPQIDWPRLAFTAWALGEFGNAVGDAGYTAAAGKAFEYLKHFLIESPLPLAPYRRCLSLAYFGQLALTREARREAGRAAELILQELSNLEFEPILFAQLASFLTQYARYDWRYRGPDVRCAELALSEFEKAEKSNADMALAQWAELANTFTRLAEVTGAPARLAASERIANWLYHQQLPSGAFPGTTRRSEPYTRGTGKVFEVLARVDPVRSRAAIERALGWLLAMQYDEETIFFVPEIMRPQILGGFRHDDLNQEAWIDAAGHILLGGTALWNTLQHEK